MQKEHGNATGRIILDCAKLNFHPLPPQQNPPWAAIPELCLQKPNAKFRLKTRQ